MSGDDNTNRRAILKSTAAIGAGIVAGCLTEGDSGNGDDGGTTDGTSGGTDDGGQDSYDITIQAAAEGSSYYALSAPYGETLREYADDPKISPTVSTTGGGTQNVRTVGQGNAEIGIAVTASIYTGYHGSGAFNQSWDNIRTMARADAYPMFHVVPEDSDIESISDLEGKRGSAGPSGSGSLAINQAILDDILGIDVDRVMLEHGEGGQALQDNDIDWWWIFMGPFATRAFSSFDVRPLGFSDDQMDQILEERPWHANLSVSSDWIPQVEGEYPNPGVNPTWFTTEDQPDDLVTEALEVLFDHPESVEEARSNPEPLAPEFSYYTEGYDVPYHSAAESFYNS